LAERLRLPAALVLAAALIVLATWSFETRRIALLDGDLHRLQQQVRALSFDDARAERLIAEVGRLRTGAERVAAARHDVLVTTNTIAQIGNALPPQTWLTAVGATPAGDWTIGGRSTRVDEIGTMLRRVQALDAAASATLVSVAATGRSGRILDFVIGWNRRT
ncbi:MAG TPA: hypothetical protein VGP41_14285, partial [Candidatus Lustribacter sp.]|nr:hypothetical protein [Candidatus Lustribacter sp.]